MPVLASEDHITPRSVLRHRPIGDDAEKQGKAAPTGITPVAQRASRTRAKKTEEDEAIAEWKRAEDEDEEEEQDIPALAPQPRKTRTSTIPKTPPLKKLQSRAKATSCCSYACVPLLPSRLLLLSNALNPLRLYLVLLALRLLIPGNAVWLVVPSSLQNNDALRVFGYTMAHWLSLPALALHIQPMSRRRLSRCFPLYFTPHSHAFPSTAQRIRV